MEALFRSYEARLDWVERAAIQAAPAAKASFPTGPVEQTAAVMHALSQSTSPLTATEISMGFKQGKKALSRVEATLSSLLRTGFIYASAEGRKFALRKAA